MSVLHVLYPVLAVTPAIVNGVAMRLDPKHGDAFGLSVMILVVWSSQMILSSWFDVPAKVASNALFDTIGVLVIVGCWLAHRAPWLFVLASLYALQVYLAAAFLWGWEVFDRVVKFSDYQRVNNVVWLLVIAVVTITGGRSVVRHARDRLRRYRDGGPGVGAPA